ncbi:5-(carboxyamino)imidazole ribonucleotide synthase [Pontibacillus marinus]|uniref:N5-carboxyaminoimidazole ribonucleotide synthase n=1 Tax=Pontibacillus marinus BH030004 = DSM 16465 TaxID=1385511 RepID=A0A0A5G9G4_9BACI|nr:5-(carboxyamino)imidazole ribonucleotide synthase [Pontibacillus marinus]KGX88679.1 phosphoribosylaminoimidazole carboxylase [Pontibacillus marinus BH030004 = DSM 16465]
MSNPNVYPGQTIGILGGGQLGKMMALSAKEMGYRIAVLDPAPYGPCAQVADQHIQASFDDRKAVLQLAEVSEVITYEFENVDLTLAQELEAKGKLPQGANALRITQDRIEEKRAMEEAGVPVAPYRVVQNPEELEGVVDELGFPCVIKTTRGGYDGKGQLKLNSSKDLEDGKAFVNVHPFCVVEAWLPFDQEVSVVMTRGEDGELELFPVPENQHEHHILKRSIVPARISETLVEKARNAARYIAEHLQFIGTFAVEMFVVGEEIYVNEMAPRPHNSGHFTIEGCNVSQFDQHIRAICGLPLLKITRPYASVMTNLLGEEVSKVIQDKRYFQGAHVHLYGKDKVTEKRKMGHVTVTGNSLDEALEKAEVFNFSEVLINQKG